MIMKSSLAAVLPIWVALTSATSTPTKTFNASAGVTPLPNKDFSNEQLGLLWAQVYHIFHHHLYSILTITLGRASLYAPYSH